MVSTRRKSPSKTADSKAKSTSLVKKTIEKKPPRKSVAAKPNSASKKTVQPTRTVLQRTAKPKPGDSFIKPEIAPPPAATKTRGKAGKTVKKTAPAKKTKVNSRKRKRAEIEKETVSKKIQLIQLMSS